jgi:hypothetical protein
LDLLQCQLFGIQAGELVGSILLAGYEGSHGEVLRIKTGKHVCGERKKRERINRIQDKKMEEGGASTSRRVTHVEPHAIRLMMSFRWTQKAWQCG